jgi:diguanylate cyclase (GGDEF)-like protein
MTTILRRTSFRGQLTATITAAIFLLALVSSLVNSWEASRRVKGYLVDQGLHITENLARQSPLALLYHAPENAREAVIATLAFPDVQRVEIVDINGSALLVQGKEGPANTTMAKNQLKPAAPASVQAAQEQESDDEWQFTAPVFAGRSEQSPFEVQEQQTQVLGYVRVVLGKQTLNRLVTSLLLANLLITLCIAAVLLGVVRLLTNRMSQPLSRLLDLMRRAEAGESGIRATPGGPRDIVEMAQAFNKMMAVLEEREVELTASRDEAVRTALLKAQFAATVSHEIRTPLNGVVGMLDMLKEMRLGKEQQDCVDVAWHSARSLMALINDILDFSKMEAGKLKLEEIDFDLRQLIEETIDLLLRQAEEKGLTLTYDMAAEVPERVKGDPLRLRQVLLNLLSNAVKFTAQGTVAVHVGCEITANGAIVLHFEVSDTGIGINDEALKHIFESFSQADRSTTRKYGGTGLGLAICKQVVEIMGGEISVSSVPGQGTTFDFSMRCAEAAAAPRQGDDECLLGKRVLVVAAEAHLRALLEQRLSALGMDCRAVAQGSAALEKLNQAADRLAPYDLLIMTSGSCDERGIDLGQRLRGEEDFAMLRLLRLDRRAARSGDGVLGSDCFLGEQLRLGRLHKALRRLFSEAGEVVSLIEQVHEVAPASKPAGAEPARKFRVLIAEDNRTNQLVAAGMLNMLGCQCEFAGNGREAVDVARRSRFGLILMDCNMPEMDGYEATAHIRNFEEPLGRRTPIVAMTANTQQGDADKCLAAGMDDYLAKPITLGGLRLKLERWLFQLGEGHAPVGEPVADTQSGPLDRTIFNDIKAALGPSLEEAIAPFIEDTPNYLDQLTRAVDDGDAKAAVAAAHVIKGSSGNLGATALSQLAKEAEDGAREGNLTRLPELLTPLRAAFAEAATALGDELMSNERSLPQRREDIALVLVVDDDRSTRSALRFALQRDGFRVEEAEDGGHCLAMLQRLQPDVILMDAVMPVMDGFAACRKIQELPHGSIIPVLMVTALEDNSSVERAFAAGASDYIPKPIHFTVLSQRIKRIIEANRAEKHIRHLAYNDVLTGLPNRAMFIDQLGQLITQARESGESVAVMFLDLDRFKYVNDTLGHEVGDRLLIAVAQRIRRSVRNADCVARLGGDEFTVVLSNVSGPNPAVAAAQNICRALATPFQIDGHDIFVSTSVGISLYPHDGIDVDTLLKHADTAMYRAKKTNSGFQFFEAAMSDSISRHLLLENDLRRALERNELEVFYQPQARLAGGQVVGMEALVRWRHPTRGLVSPVEFIPLAEETGLIIPIGEWVLRTACAQIQRWVEVGFPALSVAVNLSGRQLLQQNFADTVARALADTGLPPNLLELEITESILMEHAQETLLVLQQLRGLGVRLAIDDFGTGYSSLAYLKRFPVNVIKIDRSFVKDLPDDSDDAAIVTGIIALAHSLRLAVTAEGVETAQQLDFLRGQSCELMQGYLLSEPLPAGKFEESILSLM